ARVEGAGRVAGADGVVERAERLLRLLEVAHELGEVGHGARPRLLEALLEEAAAAAAPLGAHLGVEALVDRLAREVVDEGVGRLAARRRLRDDDLPLLELLEGERELLLALGRGLVLRVDRRELVRRRGAPEDGEELERLELLRREAAEALEDDLDDRRRDAERARLVEARPPGALLGLERARLDERAHELDDEERVAARLLVDARRERLR